MRDKLSKKGAALLAQGLGRPEEINEQIKDEVKRFWFRLNVLVGDTNHSEFATKTGYQSRRSVNIAKKDKLKCICKIKAHVRKEDDKKERLQCIKELVTKLSAWKRLW